PVKLRDYRSRCRRAMNAWSMRSPRSGKAVHDLPHAVMGDLVDFASIPSRWTDERRSAGQMSHLAGEFSSPLDRQRLRLLAAFVHYLNPPGLNNKKLEAPFAGLKASVRCDSP